MGKEYTRKVTSKDSLAAHESVLLFDDCEGVIDWQDSGSTGADFTIEFVGTRVFRGSKALHIQTKDTTPASGDKVIAIRTVSQRESKRFQITCLLDLESGVMNAKVGIGATLGKAAAHFTPKLSVDFTSAGVFYLDSGGNWVNTGLDFTANNRIWYRLEMIVDISTGKYVSVKMGDQELELDVAMREVAVGLPGLIGVNCFIELEANVQVEAFFDEIVIVEV